MEVGRNISPSSPKGERSSTRLNELRGKITFFARNLGTDLDKITKDEIHQFFFDMRKGKILRQDGKPYLAPRSEITASRRVIAGSSRPKKLRSDRILTA